MRRLPIWFWTILWSVLLTALVAGLLVWGKSEAAVPGAPWQRNAVAISAGYWQSDCQVKIVWQPLPVPVLGWSYIGDCFADGRGTEHLAYNLTGYKWMIRCGTVVHEEGHLLGLRHSRDPYNIMFKKITRLNAPNACR